MSANDDTRTYTYVSARYSFVNQNCITFAGKLISSHRRRRRERGGNTLHGIIIRRVKPIQNHFRIIDERIVGTGRAAGRGTRLVLPAILFCYTIRRTATYISTMFAYSTN